MAKVFPIGNTTALGIGSDDITSIDADGMTIAVLRFNRDHGLGMMWMPFLFTNKELPLNDLVRAEIVRMLRFHADKLETREIDKRMTEVTAAMHAQEGHT
jgi:hypothetical protein